MNIGIVCYASVGGSGIVATELGKALALRGHQVHFISTETPFRLGEFQAGLSFHQVLTPTYPLFREPQYLLSLANKIVQVVARVRPRRHPRALRRPARDGGVPVAAGAGLDRRRPRPRVVTTLHGTDITLVGNDPSYSEIVAFSIEQSDRVTAVSESLRDATYAQLGVKRRIEVIPNFLDCAIHRRVPTARSAPAVHRRRPRPRRSWCTCRTSGRSSASTPCWRSSTASGGSVPARLLLVGDGPELGTRVSHRARARHLAAVHAVGAQEEVLPLLSISDVFLLPSAQESFGLAALEAMACEVPVVASRVGGIPEVIEHGVTRVPAPARAIDEMAASAVSLLTDENLHARVGEAACRRVREHFCAERVVPMYEACYESILGSERASRAGRQPDLLSLAAVLPPVRAFPPLTFRLKRRQLLEGREHPAVSVRIGHRRHAIAPRLVLRVRNARAGLARPAERTIHILDVGIEPAAPPWRWRRRPWGSASRPILRGASPRSEAAPRHRAARHLA